MVLGVWFDVFGASCHASDVIWRKRCAADCNIDSITELVADEVGAAGAFAGTGGEVCAGNVDGVVDVLTKEVFDVVAFETSKIDRDDAAASRGKVALDDVVLANWEVEFNEEEELTLTGGDSAGAESNLSFKMPFITAAARRVRCIGTQVVECRRRLPAEQVAALERRCTMRTGPDAACLIWAFNLIC